MRKTAADARVTVVQQSPAVSFGHRLWLGEEPYAKTYHILAATISEYNEYFVSPRYIIHILEYRIGRWRFTPPLAR